MKVLRRSVEITGSKRTLRVVKCAAATSSRLAYQRRPAQQLGQVNEVCRHPARLVLGAPLRPLTLGSNGSFLSRFITGPPFAGVHLKTRAILQHHLKNGQSAGRSAAHLSKEALGPAVGVAMVLFAISLSTPGALSLRRAMVRSSLPPTANSRPMAPFCRSSIRRERH
jgi:hypothetical protein